MSTKHTPGPWRYYSATHTIYGQDRGAEKAVALIYGARRYADPQREANVRLVTAAPELLAELRECMAIMSSLRDFVSESNCRLIGAGEAMREADAAYDRAQAVIAKATGDPT
jgi:hypothetical protein